MLPSETMIWQPEFTDKTLSRKPGAVQGVHGLPVRINNCLIYQVRHALQNYSLLVNRETFGELKLFRYPDGTLFNTFYRSSADPLEGELRTVWEFDMQVKGPLAGRFDHL